MKMMYGLLSIMLCTTGLTACTSTQSKQATAPPTIHTNAMESEHQNRLIAALRELDPSNMGKLLYPVLASESRDTTVVRLNNEVVSTEPESGPELPEGDIDTAPDSDIEQEIAIAEQIPQYTAKGKLVLGSAEWVYIPGVNLTLAATIDTDSALSMLSVQQYEVFTRNSEDWVKFRVQHNDISSDEVSLPVLRWVKLNNKQATLPLVDSWIEIGEVKEKLNLLLTDLSDMPFAATLGTDFYRDIAVLDAGRRFIQPKIEK